VRVIRYGHVRHWVLGLEVVTASGELLQLNGALEKSATGFDLSQLFIGSEGTLGMVTRATLKLVRPPRRSEVLLLALAGMPAVLQLFQRCREGPFVIGAFECFSERCLECVVEHRGLGRPLYGHAPYYVLLEVEPRADDSLEGWLEQAIGQRLVEGGTMAQDGSQKVRLWQYRESISESLAARGLPHKNDLALPVRSLPAFCADLERLYAECYPTLDVYLFGHVGDGNLHVNTLKPRQMPLPEFFQHTAAADRALFSIVQRYRGSIAAEHGIGLVKKAFLHYSRSATEVAVLRQVKRTLDPNFILNPGKVFDP
jgi:FAD/FMN-containing dehydrogenase